MDKKILNYMIVGIFLTISLFFVIQITISKEIKDIRPEIPKLASQSEKNSKVQTVVTLDNNTATTSSLFKNEHDTHQSEFYTEIMPHQATEDAPALFSPPQTDNEHLSYILDAEYVPVYDNMDAFIGLKISLLPEATKVPSIKIQNGDVITHINGIALINNDSFGVAIKQLLIQGDEEAFITFDLDRNAVPYSVSLKVQP